MSIRVHDGLPYVTVTFWYQGRSLPLANVLVDTGSAGTVFAADVVLAIGLQYEPQDAVYRIHGVGGAEFVFAKQIERLSLGPLQVNDFVIEVGAMDYGLDLDGILGMDFLLRVGAVIDLAALRLYQATR